MEERYYVYCRNIESYYKNIGNGFTKKKKNAYKFTHKDALFIKRNRSTEIDIILVEEEAPKKKGKFSSSKIYDGFSTVFRQWRAEDTHCKYLHGYGISFKIDFEGDLDERNWVMDFGMAKRSSEFNGCKNVKEWMSYMFDHTTIIAADDPLLPKMKQLQGLGGCQLRVIKATGAERFAEFIFDTLNPFIVKETEGRVKIKKVTFMEHNKNTASYGE